MSQSCNLFSEGPRKRHPRALGLDELMKTFQILILVLCLIFVFSTWQPYCSPLGLLAVCLPRLLVIALRPARVVSIVAKKLAGGSQDRPLAHLLLLRSGFTSLALFVANTRYFSL
jgi:hypothetical protein